MYFNNASSYEPVSTSDADPDTDVSPRSPSKPFPPTLHNSNSDNAAIPNSPPPSFRSRVSSRRNSAETHSHHDIELDDAFAAPSDDESDSEEADASRRRLIQNTDRNSSTSGNQDYDHDADRRRMPVDRRVTEMNMFIPEQASQQAGSGGRVYGGGQGTRDGVFANISAKPTPGEDLEEKPPTYEQAAADATPPYWETTILAPGAFNSDDVFVDGLIVGSLFSFVWNALISMSFQLIGFLLTYLLHTTHAAKHGSRAGLGITLIQYGFTFRAGGSVDSPVDTPGVPGEEPSGAIPSDPNAHDFDPGMVNGGGASIINAGISTSDWISYALMIVGWFILIRAVSDFIRARRQEEMVRASPDRGLGVAVVAENERPETAV